MLSQALGRRHALLLDALAPRAPVDALFTAVAGIATKGCEGIALVGHDRQFKRLLEHLGVHRRELPFGKGTIVRVDVDDIPAPRICIPRFRLRPSTGELEDAFVGLRRAS